MPRFTFEGVVDHDGTWAARHHIPDGEVVQHVEIARVLSLALEYYLRTPGATAVNPAPAVLELPAGWAATADGVSVHQVDGVHSYARSYAYDGEPPLPHEVWVEAPCASDGTTTAATLARLAEAHVTPAVDADDPEASPPL